MSGTSGKRRPLILFELLCTTKINQLSVFVFGDDVEKALIDEVDGALIGNGSDLGTVNLTKCLPNWVLMVGLKIKLFLDGN